MNRLNFFQQISFKRLTGFAMILALALAIPLSVWVAQQETKITGRAYFEKPAPTTVLKEYGQPSQNQPTINLVWPFLGKPGDAVLIHGENFGDNPQDKALFVGNQAVAEPEIKLWAPNLIEFNLPQNSLSGPISLNVAGQAAVWDYPFTIYYLDTKIQISKPNGYLEISNVPLDSRLKIYFPDHEELELPAIERLPLPEGKTIVSLEVIDNNNLPLPFFVEPTEFGF